MRWGFAPQRNNPHEVYLADTVGHGDPAGGANIHLILALVTNHMTIAAAWHWGGSRDGETNWALNTVLKLFQEPLRLHPLGDNLPLPLSEGCLQACQADALLIQSLAGRGFILY